MTTALPIVIFLYVRTIVLQFLVLCNLTTSVAHRLAPWPLGKEVLGSIPGKSNFGNEVFWIGSGLGGLGGAPE